MKINSKLYFLGLVIVVMVLEPALKTNFDINIGESPMYTIFVSAISYFLTPKEYNDFSDNNNSTK